MNIDTLLNQITMNASSMLLKDDLSLFCEFVSYGELELAIEFMCDKIRERNVIIPEKFGRMLKVLADKFGISPARSWWSLPVQDSEGKRAWRLCFEGPDLIPPILSIFERVKKSIDTATAQQIKEFFDAGESELAVDELWHTLVQDKIPISKLEVDQLRTIWLDMGNNPAELTGFVITESAE